MFVFMAIPLDAATIKFFTDYPNSVPVGSDFFVLQRNNSYINASRDQVKNDWFNNPVFTGSITGDGAGLTNVSSLSQTVSNFNATYITNFLEFSTNLFVTQEFVTNLFATTEIVTNLFVTNLFALNGNFIFDNNGNGTNTTNWGVSTFQEIGTVNFYPTNFFTGLTNFALLGTDGDGKLILGSSTTNLVATNIYVTTLYAETNFSTNLFFVSGKGNTLIITNNLSVGGVQTNLNIAASSAVITKADQVLTNAVNAVGAFTNSASGPPSFGLIQSNVIAAGISPILNLQASTNLLTASISSPTNGVSTASSIDFSIPEAVTNIAGAVSQTSVVNFNQTNINHAIRYYVNRTGSDQTITVGTWETDSGRQTATTYINTNNTTLALMFTLYAGQFTNVASYKTFR